MQAAEVALVSMPFALPLWPSLGLSLLKAHLQEAGIRSDILYLNVDFAARVEFEAYLQVANGEPNTAALVGEWIFAEALFGVDKARDERYLQQVLHGGHPDYCSHHTNEKVDAAERALRAAVAPFLEEMLGAYPWSQYKVVGFTSVFQQYASSLAFARLLRERFPHLRILFGGANCEGEMGLALLESFDWVDMVVSGEGDQVIVPLVRALLSGGEPPMLKGVLTRERTPLLRELSAACVAPSVTEMDRLPYPCFDDFFARAEEIKRMAPDMQIRCVFETSRGCWWGARSHCTFCGLNGSNMEFRSKSAERALAEIEEQTARFGHITRSWSATDNILDMKYFRDFLPALRDRGISLDVFYETKANLRKEQVRLLRDAGVRCIQPGIESFSTDVLNLMRKGITAIQNVQLLKWCMQYGVVPVWNLLYGFPGEKPAAYTETLQRLPLLVHLKPPGACPRVRFDRFSPYFEAPTAFGLKNLRPYAAYEMIYAGLSPEQLSRNAYYFVADYPEMAQAEVYMADVLTVVKDWRRREGETALFHENVGQGQIIICDARDEETFAIYLLDGVMAALYRACDAVTSQTRLLEVASAAVGRTVTWEEVEAMLTESLAAGLLMREGQMFLALSVELSDGYTPPAPALERLAGQDRLRPIRLGSSGSLLAAVDAN